MKSTCLPNLDANGFVVVPGVLPAGEVENTLTALELAFASDATGSTLRTSDGSVYGARNLLKMWPPVVETWKKPPLPDIVCNVLGPHFGLVRVLYFDKPPEQSWALPWHQDMTIAVKNNQLKSNYFARPTTKAGVPHVEGPEWLLERMLTLRLHLDDMTDDNGPLKVLPGSHRGRTELGPVTILGQRGDVLLMRPLLSHSSNRSRSNTRQHRRVLHFEFAGVAVLPDQFEWHDFVQ